MKGAESQELLLQERHGEGGLGRVDGVRAQMTLDTMTLDTT